MRLQDALQEFLLQTEADGRSPHTIRQYHRHVSALIGWLSSTGSGTDVADLTPGLIARFFADGAARASCRGGPKKATSLNTMRTSIRCFCVYLRDAGLVAANPARLLRRARCTPPRPRALREHEQARLHKVLGSASGFPAERDRMLVELLLGTGIRLSSALSLCVEDLDFQHAELSLRVTKNDHPMTVVVPRELMRKLGEYVGNRTAGPLFRAGNRRLSTRHAQRRIACWMAQAEIAGRSAHSLRHSFANTLLARTGDLHLVQMALHHRSIVSTTVYVQVDTKLLRRQLDDAQTPC